MPSLTSTRCKARSPFSSERGSLLLVALLFAAGISLVLVSYLDLGRTSLKLGHRSFFAQDATNLAEAGLEEAIYCFNQMAAGTPAATAWSEWTLSGSNAMRTLPPFNRDQNAVGIVKVHVTGYDGSNAAPVVLSQVAITPFDGGAPMVKTLQVGLSRGGSSPLALVGIDGVTLKGKSFADSFNSNPTSSPTGPWLAYSSAIARSQTAAVVLSGALIVGGGKVFGNAYLGSGVTPPATGTVTGTITTNYAAAYPMPVYPTPASVSQSYNVGSAIPAMLPVGGHLPAADGRYYYFCSSTTIGSVAITAGSNVTLVGTNTGLGPGLAVPANGTCFIYMDGPVNLSRSADLTNSAWAGALRIHTSTTATCNLGNTSQFMVCLYAPYAPLSASGGSGGGMLVGYYVARTITTGGNLDFHYDEALQATGASTGWVLSRWLELQSAAERATVAPLSGNFLR